MVREGFSALLAAQSDLSVVGQATDGADAVRQARQLTPDVILMDVRMPPMYGLEATRQILQSDEGHRRAGASGFLLKDSSADELVQAVRVIAAGEALLAPSVIAGSSPISRVSIDNASECWGAGPSHPPRELEVLRLIARGLSNAEISESLVVATQMTKAHIGRILMKLNLRDRAQAVVIAYESGLVSPSDP